MEKVKPGLAMLDPDIKTRVEAGNSGTRGECEPQSYLTDEGPPPSVLPIPELGEALASCREWTGGQNFVTDPSPDSNPKKL